ncbi:MAG: hemolysin III family protein [Kofleriaceae bacterium]
MALVMAGARPRMRGVSHRFAFHVALVAGAVLVVCAHDRRTMIATAIYAALLAGMFGVSATLHRSDWSPRAFGWLRRADHAMIFACIAGTYTPLCVLGMPAPAGMRLFALAWTAAGLGILRAALWPHAPRWITSVLYVAVGWVAVAYGSDVRAALAGIELTMLVVGGAWFTVGAFVYLVRRPDPWPSVFGYHEVFHVMIILGCACHFVAVAHVAFRQ